MSRCRRSGSVTRDDHCHRSHRQRPEEKKQNLGEKGTGMANRPGETCAHEDVMKRNPSVGRKLPVTWLRQHAIVSGIIKHIGSICPWKRNTLSPRVIQEPYIDLCSPDRSVGRSVFPLSLYLSLSLVFVRLYRNVAPIGRGPTLSYRLDRGSVVLRDRTSRERLLPDDRSY